MERMLNSVLTIIKLSLTALVIGLILGLVLGILRTVDNRTIRIVFRLYLEIFRIVPLLVLLFVFYYILPEMLNHQIDNQVVSVFVFALWISAEMSDLVRKGLQNVSKKQLEIGKSLGFSTIQMYRVIILPQGLPALIPDTLNLVTRVIKSTSLLLMIGVPEMIRVGTQIIENYAVKLPTASFWVYGVILFLYFGLCYPLGRLANGLEKKYRK